jgi:sigma-B regulation protein RsbU (phosphoserine phosphatase)
VPSDISTPTLYWQDSDRKNCSRALDQDLTTIGRQGCDVLLVHPSVSRRHASVVRVDGRFQLVDNGSKHGTTINGEKVESRELESGDRIELGKERVPVHFSVSGGGRPRDYTDVIERSISDIQSATSASSILEKISYILEFKYRWEHLFTPDVAFEQILDSLLKISGAERGFILVRNGTDFVYASGMDSNGRGIEESEFQASHTVVSRVVNSGEPLFMTEELDRQLAVQQSIVRMGVRAVACVPLHGLPAEADTPVVLGILYLDSRKPMHSLSGLDQKILRKLAVEAGNVLERVELVKSIEQRQALERELTLAEETQKALLPREMPQIPGYRIDAYSKPTRYVGGDFYDFILGTDGSFDALLADVSGKGVSASLLSSLVLGCMRLQLRTGCPLAEAMGALNQLLLDTAPDRFVTMFVIHLDRTGRGQFISAGHNPAYIYRSASDRLEEIPSNCMLVGAFDFATFQCGPITLHSGDVLLIYSDGLSEAENTDGDMLGEDVVRQIVQRSGPKGAEKVKSDLLKEVERFTGGRAQSDDITLVTIESRDGRATTRTLDQSPL